jgi:TPR repeat protein
MRAQYNLGGMVGSGRGTPRDSVRSYMWLLLAADAGAPAAGADRARLAERLSACQIGSAHDLRHAWHKTRGADAGGAGRRAA